MKVVIAGGGRYGANVARRLAEKGVKVYIIDISERTCSKLGKTIPALIICGDACDPKTLNEIGMEDTDYFLAMTGNDELNIICALLAKELGAKNVIVRINNPEHIEACKELGIEESLSIHPADLVARDIEKMILKQS
ncbi:MAG: potassium channel family protein [Candidatus Nezhaarchaeales archaeon]